jgi:hypothetical protein
MSEAEQFESGTEIPGEAGESSLAPNSDQVFVEKARAKGWTPLETWRGDPEDWVDAKEFLGREKLFSKIHTLQKELVNIRNATQKDFQEIGKYFAQMREVEYKRALNDLRAQRREALQEGDLEKADQLDVQMDEIKEQRQQATNVPQPTATGAIEDPTFAAWKVENSWFENDQELRQEAIGIGVGYANANKNATQEQVLEYVAKTIKKFNPEKFGQRKQSVDDSEPLNSVESPTRRATNPTRGRGKLSVNDLNDMERSVMKTLITRGVLKEQAAKNNRSQEAEYLAQIAAAKGL